MFQQSAHAYKSIKMIKYQSVMLEEAQHVKCAQKDGFCKLGHIYSAIYHYAYAVNQVETKF